MIAVCTCLQKFTKLTKHMLLFICMLCIVANVYYELTVHWYLMQSFQKFLVENFFLRATVQPSVIIAPIAIALALL